MPFVLVTMRGMSHKSCFCGLVLPREVRIHVDDQGRGVGCHLGVAEVFGWSIPYEGEGEVVLEMSQICPSPLS